MNIEKLAIVKDLPLGAIFKYEGSEKLFVLLDRSGFGLCAEYSEESSFIGQGVYSITNDIGLDELKVIHVKAFAKALQSSEPVAKPDAWLVPMILDFTGAKKVHFTRSEKGKNLTDDELKAELQGSVIWKAETVYINDSNEPITDKYGVRHYAKPLFTHPPASVPLEKYNKLLDALNKGKNALASARFLFLKHLPDHNWLAGFDKDFDAVKQAIAEAEAEGKEE